MARHGISYDDVISAANALKGQGKSVTIENVRGFLGTGSAGTINQHLRRWKEAQNSTQKIASKENLPEGLAALVKGLWEGVLAQSTEQFTPIELNYQQEISELKAELEKYRNNNQRWQKMFNQWQQEKTVLASEKLTLEQALEFAHKENQSLHGKYDGLLQQLQEKQERVEELHRLHQQTQTNLEHYRESAREQRLLDQQQYDREKQQSLSEIKVLKEQSVQQQVKYSELCQQNHQIEQSYIELENKYNKSESLIETLKHEIKQLEKTNIERQQASQHWQNQFHDLQEAIEKKINEVIVLQADNKLLNQQLIDRKNALQNIQDQNKLLNQEKWELAQERAKLEGQVEQIQKMINA
jgi:hypothetical protein